MKKAVRAQEKHASMRLKLFNNGENKHYPNLIGSPKQKTKAKGQAVLQVDEPAARRTVCHLMPLLVQTKNKYVPIFWSTFANHERGIETYTGKVVFVTNDKRSFESRTEDLTDFSIAL